jgi:hypothetical protein
VFNGRIVLDNPRMCVSQRSEAKRRCHAMPCHATHRGSLCLYRTNQPRSAASNGTTLFVLLVVAMPVVGRSERGVWSGSQVPLSPKCEDSTTFVEQIRRDAMLCDASSVAASLVRNNPVAEIHEQAAKETHSLPMNISRLRRGEKGHSKGVAII